MNKPVHILQVEDSAIDALMTREALQNSELRFKLSIVEDGHKAWEFLRRAAKNESTPYPDLILLDLNLPRKNGRELLAEIKSDPKFQTIPVIVLTTSSAPEDIASAYKLHANCYIIKPVDFLSFSETILAIQNFWFSTVTLKQ